MTRISGRKTAGEVNDIHKSSSAYVWQPRATRIAAKDWGAHTYPYDDLASKMRCLEQNVPSNAFTVLSKSVRKTSRRAMQACASCLVRNTCLAQAMNEDAAAEPDDEARKRIYGGLTYGQRTDVREQIVHNPSETAMQIVRTAIAGMIIQNCAKTGVERPASL